MARVLFAAVLSVTALFLSLSLLVAGSNMQGTLSAVRLGMDGFSPGTIGLVMAAHSVGFVTGAIYGVNIIRRVGHIRAFAAFAAIACASVLAHPLLVEPVLWFALRVVLGFVVAGLMTVGESWISDRATAQTRGTLLGIYTINFYLASAAGQFLVAVADPATFVPFTLVAILMVLSLVPLCLTSAQVPVLPAASSRLRFRELVAASPTGVSGALVGGVALGAFLAMGPVYALQAGLETAQVSVYMGSAVLCAILLQWPAGWASDIYGRRRVLVGLAAGGALAAALVALLGTFSVGVLFAGTGAFVAMAASLYPVSLANTNDHLHAEHAVGASAGMLRSYGIGTIIGPVAAALAMGQLGPGGLFAFVAVTLVLLALVIYYRVSFIPGVPLAEQGDYVAASPLSTPMIAELDPRQEEFAAYQEPAVANYDYADEVELEALRGTARNAADESPKPE